MRNYTIWVSDEETTRNQLCNKKAIKNQLQTIKLIDSIGGLSGNVLDIGNRNILTEILEKEYGVKIDSTVGDLDIAFICPEKQYDFVHYNNVIEHQFNPLFTLLEIGKVLKSNGILILGCPLKPKWITTATCHFHEFDQKAYNEIINRAGFKEVKRLHFWHTISIIGFRPFLASFFKRQIVCILQKK